MEDTLIKGKEQFENWLKEGNKTDIAIALAVYAHESKYRECEVMLEYLHTNY